MAYVPRLSKASAHQEVAERYRLMAKRAALRYPKSKTRTLAAIRIAELTALFADIWGLCEIPADDIGYQAVRVMAHHMGRLRDASRRTSSWIDYCARWMLPVDRERLINEAQECPLKWTADKLAWKFKVTQEQRRRLALKTIGAIDLSKAERIKTRRAHNKAASRAYRRANGAKPRAQYLAQFTKPWIAAGISRATWYRRLRVRQ